VQRRELAVHHDDAVAANGDRDVAALAFEHVGLVAKVGGLDLDLGEIGRLRLRRARDQHGGACDEGDLDGVHGRPPAMRPPSWRLCVEGYNANGSRGKGTALSKAACDPTTPSVPP